MELQLRAGGDTWAYIRPEILREFSQVFHRHVIQQSSHSVPHELCIVFKDVGQRVFQEAEHLLALCDVNHMTVVDVLYRCLQLDKNVGLPLMSFNPSRVCSRVCSGSRSCMHFPCARGPPC
eukprot:2355029-Amphidinium_carterae.1